ncbi:MAG: non-specific endonuclease [Chlamydiales bacterium]|jgi:endonuclease G|nr:non-specific endonuclease [Chlamydiales bacterium]
MAKRIQKKHYLKPKLTSLKLFILGTVIGSILTFVALNIDVIKVQPNAINVPTYIKPKEANSSFQAEIKPLDLELERFGAPIVAIPVQRSNYKLAYDGRNHTAFWVMEHLTADKLKGNTSRSSNFKEDPSIPIEVRSTLDDYKGSGFDRGHLAPAANHKSSAQAMDDTFYLSNMSAQVPEFNRGYWSKLESYVRGLVSKHKNLYVVTGPLYLPELDKDGKKYVKYQVIGPHNVAVPTHFFKVILAEKPSGHLKFEAYVLPNKKIDDYIPLEKFSTTVQQVEKLAGLIFFNKIDNGLKKIGGQAKI